MPALQASRVLDGETHSQHSQTNSKNVTAYDWIAIGGGITGAALAYELTRQGFRTLSIERCLPLQEATRYSYGGLSFWSGRNDFERQLARESRKKHRALSEELDADTELRELDAIAPIAPEEDAEAILAAYKDCEIVPRPIDAREAIALEPLLNPTAIASAFTVRHGHVNPIAMAAAYRQATERLGGKVAIDEIVGFSRTGDRIRGAIGKNDTYAAAHIAVCAGGASRHLLQGAGIAKRPYFTHAEVIETPPVEVRLSGAIVAANLKRFRLEAAAVTPDAIPLWDEPDREFHPPILDVGAIQFLDGSLRIGQISRVLADPNAAIDAAESDRALRKAVGRFLPALENLPGTWHRCLVAYSGDPYPLAGPLPGVEGLHLFSGFTNPLVFVSPLAERFARAAATGADDPFLQQTNPDR